MDSNLINKVENSHYKKTEPKFNVGDTVEVSTIIREGEKSRTQKFKGLVMAIRGSGTRKMFTVRKISYGVGVEKIFPLHSPNVSGVVVLKTGSVRRSKIYYMRDRVGRSALKVKAGRPVVVEEHADEAEEVNEENVAPIVDSAEAAEVAETVEVVDTAIANEESEAAAAE